MSKNVVPVRGSLLKICIANQILNAIHLEQKALLDFGSHCKPKIGLYFLTQH